jgi:hypothetical protein
MENPIYPFYFPGILRIDLGPEQTARAYGSETIRRDQGMMDC